MIPEPLKWVGALTALVILVVVVTPMAVEAMFDTVSLSDEGGLFGGTDDEVDDLEPAEEDEAEPDEEEEEAEEAENGENGEEDDEPEDVPDSYVVESGDTLYDIAQEVYGDGERWPEIAEANDLDNDTLSVGEELDIP